MGAWNCPDSKDVSEASGSYHDHHLFPNGPLISETPTESNQPHGFTLPEQYQLVPLLPFLRAPVPRISVMAPQLPTLLTPVSTVTGGWALLYTPRGSCRDRLSGYLDHPGHPLSP